MDFYTPAPAYTHASLQTATTAPALLASAVSRDWRHILDTTDLHASTSKRAQRSLRARAGSARAGATHGAELDVQRADAELLAAGRNVLRCKHGGIGRRFVAIRLDFHATGDTDDCLATRDIGDVNEGVVERGEDVRHPEDDLALAHLRAEGYGLHFGFFLLWRHRLWNGSDVK